MFLDVLWILIYNHSSELNPLTLNGNYSQRNVYNFSILTIKMSHFFDCHATYFGSLDGGAIFAVLSQAQISYSIFSSNFAGNSGGALRFEKCQYININQSLFSDNKAEISSGVMASQVIFNLELKANNFTFNKCNDRISIISFFNCDNPNIEYIINFQNSSPKLSSFFFTNGDSTIYHTYFFRESNEYAIMGVQYASLYLFDCLFAENNRSIFWNSNFELTIENCLFDDQQNRTILIIQNNIPNTKHIFYHNSTFEKFIPEVNIKIFHQDYSKHSIPLPFITPQPHISQIIQEKTFEFIEQFLPGNDLGEDPTFGTFIFARIVFYIIICGGFFEYYLRTVVIRKYLLKVEQQEKDDEDLLTISEQKEIPLPAFEYSLPQMEQISPPKQEITQPPSSSINNSQDKKKSESGKNKEKVKKKVKKHISSTHNVE